MPFGPVFAPSLGLSLIKAALTAAGIRSRIRAQLLADGDPRPNGFMAFRTIVAMAKTLEERGDPKAVFSSEVLVKLP